MLRDYIHVLSHNEISRSTKRPSAKEMSKRSGGVARDAVVTRRNEGNYDRISACRGPHA